MTAPNSTNSNTNALMKLKKSEWFNQKVEFDGSIFTLVAVRAMSPNLKRTGRLGTHWWLQKDGVTVSYCKTIWEDEEPFVISEIETREAFRRKGYSEKLIEMIENSIGLTVHSSGTYSQLGALACSRLPLANAEAGREIVWEEVSTFVTDWDEMIPKYF